MVKLFQKGAEKTAPLKESEGFLNDFKHKDLGLICYFVVVVYLFLCTFMKITIDGDVLWHIKTGEYIARAGHLLGGEDVFSWLEGLSWSPHEQIYDLLLYGIYSLTGFFGVKMWGFLLQCLTLMIGFIFNYHEFLTKGKGEACWIGYTLFCMLSLSLFGVPSTARPQDLSLFLLILTYYLYYKYHTEPDLSGQNKRNLLYFIIFPVVSLLVANLHGGSVYLVYTVPVLFLLGYFINFLVHFRDDGYAEQYRTDKAIVIRTLISVVTGFVVSLLNPLGIGIYTYAFKHSEFAYTHIAEWQSLHCTLPMLLYFFFIAFSFSFTDLKECRKATLFRALILAAFLVLAIKTSRFYITLIYLSVMFGFGPLLSLYEKSTENLTEILRCKSCAGVSEGNDTPSFKNGFLTVFLQVICIFKNKVVKKALERVALLGVAFGILCYLYTFFNVALLNISLSNTEPYEINMTASVTEYNAVTDDVDKDAVYSDYSYFQLATDLYSEPCLKWLQLNGITEKYFTFYNSGSYYIFNDMKSFMDARCDPFLSSFSRVNCFEEFGTALSSANRREAVHDYFKSYDIEYVVVFPYIDTTSAYSVLSEDTEYYELVFEDKTLPFSSEITALPVENEMPISRKLAKFESLPEHQRFSRGYIYRVK